MSHLQSDTFLRETRLAFEHEDDTFVLKYSGVRKDRVLALDHEAPEVEAITCEKSALKMSFMSVSSALHYSENLMMGDLLIGGGSWKCGLGAFVRRVRSVQLEGLQLLVYTESAELVHAYRDLDVHYEIKQRVVAYPDDGMVDFGMPSGLNGAIHSPRSEGVLSSIWSDVKSLASNAYSYVTSIAKGVGDLASGDVSGSVTRNAPIRYDWDKAISAEIECYNCYVQLDPSVLLSISISSFTLNSFKATASSTATLSAGFLATVSGAWQREYPLDLGSRTFGTYAFAIGPVPIVLTPFVEVTLIAGIQAQSAGSVRASGAISGTAGFGVVKSDAASPANLVQQRTLSVSNTGVQATANAQVTASLTVRPTLFLQFEFLGGPYLALGSGFQGKASYDSTSTTCNLGVEYQLNAFFGMAVGASVSISALGTELYSADLGSVEVYSKVWPLTSGCYQPSTPSSRQRSTGTLVHTLQEGTSLEGTVQLLNEVSPACAFWQNQTAEDIAVSAQVIRMDPVTGRPTHVVIGFNFEEPAADDANACLFQAAYELFNDTSGGVYSAAGNVDNTFLFSTLVPSPSKGRARGLTSTIADVRYASCIFPGAASLDYHDREDVTIGTFTEDYSQLTLNFGASCAEAVLTAAPTTCTYDELDTSAPRCPSILLDAGSSSDSSSTLSCLF